MVAFVLVPVADRTRVTLITSTSSPMSQDLASGQLKRVCRQQQ